MRSLLADQDRLASIVLPLLEAWRGIRGRAAELGRQLVRDARQSRACRILMSIPGIGAITATSFTTAIGVLAEGIENEAELAVLKVAGISVFQGYYFAKPGFMTLPEVAAFTVKPTHAVAAG